MTIPRDQLIQAVAAALVTACRRFGEDPERVAQHLEPDTKAGRLACYAVWEQYRDDGLRVAVARRCCGVPEGAPVVQLPHADWWDDKAFDDVSLAVLAGAAR